MYGGGHYIASAAAEMTPQGRAISEAASKFGDGKTLPFPPCKRYYNPYSEASGAKTQMYACRLHDKLRRSRMNKEGGSWRGGEKRLDEFWTSSDQAPGHEKPRNPAKQFKLDNEEMDKKVNGNEKARTPAPSKKTKLNNDKLMEFTREKT